MCGIVSGTCRGEIKIGQLGFDRSGLRLTVHAIGVAFVVGIDADGTMNGADAIWSLLNLELWYRTHIDGEGVQAMTAKPLTVPSATSLRATA